MRSLVGSLKRMYLSGKITRERVESMSAITDDEKEYILKAEGDLH